MIESLRFGEVLNLIKDQVYALPARFRTLYTDTGAAVILESNDINFVINTTVTLTDGEGTSGGAAFIKCTSGDINLYMIP